MSDKHQEFLGRLTLSQDAVFKVARMQSDKGRYVEIPPLRKAPTAAKAQSYTDEGDAFFFIKYRGEVKKLTINFTCADDYPYPDIFVASKEPIDRIGDTETVAAFYLMSNDERCVAVIPWKTKPFWTERTVLASNTGNMETKYVCPLEHVRFEMVIP